MGQPGMGAFSVPSALFPPSPGESHGHTRRQVGAYSGAGGHLGFTTETIRGASSPGQARRCHLGPATWTCWPADQCLTTGLGAPHGCSPATTSSWAFHLKEGAELTRATGSPRNLKELATIVLTQALGTGKRTCPCHPYSLGDTTSSSLLGRVFCLAWGSGRHNMQRTLPETSHETPK